MRKSGVLLSIKSVKMFWEKMKIIAEDLGFITESVIELLNKTGYLGMKVLQFAVDSREESDYMPHKCRRYSDYTYAGLPEIRIGRTHEHTVYCRENWKNI